MSDKGRETMNRSEMAEINGGGPAERYETYRMYIVQAGDTLDSIASCFHVSVVQIKKWNGLRGNSDLTPGMALKIYQ